MGGKGTVSHLAQTGLELTKVSRNVLELLVSLSLPHVYGNYMYAAMSGSKLKY